jgi:hypothetical protein
LKRLQKKSRKDIVNKLADMNKKLQKPDVVESDDESDDDESNGKQNSVLGSDATDFTTASKTILKLLDTALKT